MEREITDLRSKLKECEKERLKAAQYGLQLMERQTELQNQLDKCHEEMMTQKCRSHRQEVNDLKNKLEKLKVELDGARLIEKQLKQKLDHQEEVLAHKSEKLRLMEGVKTALQEVNSHSTNKNN
ncbi:Protein Spindly [Microtus ochrogaster]|uniref:Protein Spindly n=1 Tax=Microtus ochrogaster TaxID=79684 RepID=A0A8J6KMX5_MICOH|nr:Protein Spindly [Microtus ochrogaster]